MVKTIFLAASAIALSAAAPTRYGSFSAPLAQGITVMPQRDSGTEQLAAGAFTPAPLPDNEASAPVLRTLGPAQAKFSAGLFQSNRPTRGDGYVPGSTVEGNEQKRFHPTPGINMSVPLQ